MNRKAGSTLKSQKNQHFLLNAISLLLMNILKYYEFDSQNNKAGTLKKRKGWLIQKQKAKSFLLQNY